MNSMKNALLKLRFPTLQGQAVLFVCLTAIVSALSPVPCRAQSPIPKITSISKVTTAQDQTIIISGTGFGTQEAYNGDSVYIALDDQTADPSWQAGYAGCCYFGEYVDDTVTLDVRSWSNTKIVIGGFTGEWDEPGYDWTLSIGDTEQFMVWNVQTGDGPATATVTVVGQKTTTTMTSSPNPSALDQSVTFTATVTSASGAPADGETVSFMQGKTLEGTATLSGGSASFSTSTLKKGSHSITAIYGGDTVYDSSRSPALKQVVQ